MAAVTGIDSNNTSVRYAFESTLGVLPGTPDWILAEPNAEPDFGGDVKTMARDIITADRQSVKGSVVDVEAGVSIEQDFTLTNQRALLQAFMFANERGLVSFGGAGQITAITATTVTAASGLTIFQVDDLVIIKGATNSGNNDVLARVTAAAAGTVTMAGAAFIPETPPTLARLIKVGIQCASADINVVITGPFANYTSTTTNFLTRLVLTPGQTVYVGGDLAAEQFVNAANNGSKRVLTVTATNLQVDKSHLAMIAETGTGKTIRIFVTAALKNEQGVLFVTKPTQWERTLGAPDDALPAQVQSQYEVGCMASEYSFDAKPASKITTSMKFMGKDEETRTGVVGVKTGNRPALPNVDAVNTSADPRRYRVAKVDTVAALEAPNPLWALTESMSFSINNNIERNLALGTIGAARFTIGSFDVTGSMNPYFSDISVLAAARANVDVTADLFVAQRVGGGFAVDFPLMTLSKARAEVAQDKAIMVPCDFVAHSGEKVNPALDYTLMWTFFDYLPLLAQTQP